MEENDYAQDRFKAALNLVIHHQQKRRRDESYAKEAKAANNRLALRTTPY